MAEENIQIKSWPRLKPEQREAVNAFLHSNEDLYDVHDSLGRFFDEDGHVIHVAKSNSGKILGLGFTKIEGNLGTLHYSLVDPGSRGKGIGIRLLHARMQWLKDNHADTALVAAENPTVRKTLQDAGFGVEHSSAPLARQMRNQPLFRGNKFLSEGIFVMDLKEPRTMERILRKISSSR